MRYFSMFSGIGGFELGINRAYEKQNLYKESISSKGMILPIVLMVVIQMLLSSIILKSED